MGQCQQKREHERGEGKGKEGGFKDTGFIELSNGLRNGQSKHQNSLAIGQGQHNNSNNNRKRTNNNNGSSTTINGLASSAGELRALF